MMYKNFPRSDFIGSIQQKSKLRVILSGCIVFISASPLFENLEKLIYISFAIILYLPIKKNIAFTINNVVILAIFGLILIVYAPSLDLINGFGIDYITFGFFYSFFLSFLWASIVTVEEFLYAIERVVFWTLLAGLPIFIISKYSPSIVWAAFDYTYGDTSHKTLGFINFHILDGVVYNRFVGFGREPGLSQVFYLIALWYRLKWSCGKFDIPSLLIIAAIFLGMSTAGLFTMVIVLLLSIPVRNFVKYGLLFSPLLVFYVYDLIVYHFQYKLYGSSSFASRYDRYLDFFSNDMTDVLLGFGNAFFINNISPAGIGGWDTFLQFSQRFGMLAFLVLATILFYKNRAYPQVAVIIFMGFISQTMWFYPAIAFFYFSRNRVKASACDEHSLKPCTSGALRPAGYSKHF